MEWALIRDVNHTSTGAPRNLQRCPKSSAEGSISPWRCWNTRQCIGGQFSLTPARRFSPMYFIGGPCRLPSVPHHLTTRDKKSSRGNLGPNLFSIESWRSLRLYATERSAAFVLEGSRIDTRSSLIMDISRTATLIIVRKTPIFFTSNAAWTIPAPGFDEEAEVDQEANPRRCSVQTNQFPIRMQTAHIWHASGGRRATTFPLQKPLPMNARRFSIARCQISVNN